MTPARPVKLGLALTVAAWLATAGAALAAHPRAGAFYGGSLGKGAGFQVSRNGKTMTFRGKATVGMICGSNATPGTALAQFNLDPRSVPRAKIHRNGAFDATRSEGTVVVTIAGHFTGGGSAMIISVRTTGGGLGRCASAKSTLHSSGRRLKRRR